MNVAARTVSLLEDLVRDVKKAFAQGDNEEEILWKEKIKIEMKEEEKGGGDAAGSGERGRCGWRGDTWDELGERRREKAREGERRRETAGGRRAT